MAIFWAKLSAAIRQTRTILNLPAGVRSGTLLRYFLSVTVALSTSCHVAAQLDTNEAHVLPRACLLLLAIARSTFFERTSTSCW